MRVSCLTGLLFATPFLSLLAQSPALEMNVVYVCTDGQSFKVFSCTGPGSNAACDFQNYRNGQAFQRGQALRVQLSSLIPSKCHAQTAAEAQKDPHRGEIPAPPRPPAQRTAPAGVQGSNGQGGNGPGVGGFKVGDTVQINTAFGWMNAKVMQVNGANYFVHADSGADVWKPYPSEVRRIGPLNAEDHAHGLYALHDRVQVLFQGKWVDSEVVTTFALGDRYEVTLPGNQTGYATPREMRFVSVAPPKPTTKAGVPPKPGFTSCGTRFDGRWGAANGGPGPRIVFQAGKANVDDGITPQTLECWVNGDQMILRLVNDPLNGGSDITFDVNKDGTIESTYFGQLKKR
ncbi:MAG TPA: hypothetical protein VMU80_23955 [Bryobacteraceae bacterium]|nr:hypothetical protein [Bryobacteraceae bacterium]HUO32291.1 hypothetical protein [Bryobacteraceae bacterium]